MCCYKWQFIKRLSYFQFGELIDAMQNLLLLVWGKRIMPDAAALLTSCRAVTVRRWAGLTTLQLLIFPDLPGWQSTA